VVRRQTNSGKKKNGQKTSSGQGRGGKTKPMLKKRGIFNGPRQGPMVRERGEKWSLRKLGAGKKTTTPKKQKGNVLLQPPMHSEAEAKRGNNRPKRGRKSRGESKLHENELLAKGAWPNSLKEAWCKGKKTLGKKCPKMGRKKIFGRPEKTRKSNRKRKRGPVKKMEKGKRGATRKQKNSLGKSWPPYASQGRKRGSCQSLCGKKTLRQETKGRVKVKRLAVRIYSKKKGLKRQKPGDGRVQERAIQVSAVRVRKKGNTINSR